MARPGFPSFLTKQRRISLKIKAGAKKSSTFRYVLDMEKTALSAPSRRVMASEQKNPAAANKTEQISPSQTVLVNISSAPF